MNNSAKGNMYEATIEATRELFGMHLSGSASGLVCVVSSNTVEADAREALGNSLAALGYGKNSCTFVSLTSHDGEVVLDPQALFLVVEGLDPLCFVAFDKQAADVLGKAYRGRVPLDSPVRLFGRSGVAFSSFASMLSSPESKQKAWALLKKLPRFGER